MKTDATKCHREAWLKSAAAIFAARLFAPKGYKVPEKLRVSVGFPYGRRGGKGQHAIGECWNCECSKDNAHEIFISPELDDPARVCDVLIHEMVHATVGVAAQHGPEYRKCALAVGLEGKMTETVASEDLKAKLVMCLAELPDYPHRSLNPAERTGPKKQGTRMKKVTCPSCGYTVRAAAKWLAVGVPTCPCGEDMQPEEPEEEGE